MSRRKDTGVFELPDGRCGIDYRDAEGHRHKELIGRRKLAIEEYRRRKLEILEGKFRPPRRERKTFGEVVDEYLESQKGLVSYRTLYNDEGRARIIKPLLGHELIDQIEPHLLNRTLGAIRSGRQITSGHTVNRYRGLLSGVFTFALNAKYIQENPMNAKTVKVYPAPKGRIRYLTADEERALRRILLLNYPEHRLLEVDLALYTGLRKGEQYTARWSNVDLENRFMTVLGKSRGGIQERTIPLNTVAVETLKKLYLLSGQTSYVIPVRKAKHNHVDRTGKVDERRWFEQALEAAGIENFRWHDLRHTFASRMVMGGVPLQTVMEWMGHKDIHMTMIYSHLAPEHHWEEMKKIKDTRKDSSTPDVMQIDESKAG